MSLYVDSKAAQLGLTIMFTIVIIVNPVGNTFVCLVITVYPIMGSVSAHLLADIDSPITHFMPHERWGGGDGEKSGTGQ